MSQSKQITDDGADGLGLRSMWESLRVRDIEEHVGFAQIKSNAELEDAYAAGPVVDIEMPAVHL